MFGDVRYLLVLLISIENDFGRLGFETENNEEESFITFEK